MKDLLVLLGALTVLAVGQNAPPPPQASRSAPCTQPEYREFDFWVGSWDVEVKGKVVGHNDVTLEQDGCLIVENWRSLISRETGSSFNYYDKQDQKWHQLYIPNNGIARSYPPLAGRLKGGAMVLVNSDDPRKIDRWTWTPLAGGKVRQRAEQSKDGGNTWTTTWDSVYFRRMSQRATGSFEVKLSPQAPAAETEDANIGRMIIDKRFHGELEATSKGEMLSAMSGVKGSAGYVALERVTGTLAGKKGSFVLQHSGTMDRGKPSLTVSVVPDSGIEDLQGLSGTMQIIVEGAKHSYVFEYSLPAR